MVYGITFNNYVHKLSQYADDPTLTLSDIMSILNAFHCVNTFCKYSGIKLIVNRQQDLSRTI